MAAKFIFLQAVAYAPRDFQYCYSIEQLALVSSAIFILLFIVKVAILLLKSYVFRKETNSNKKPDSVPFLHHAFLALFIFIVAVFILQKKYCISFIGARTNDLVYLIAFLFLDLYSIFFFTWHVSVMYRVVNITYRILRTTLIAGFASYILITALYGTGNDPFYVNGFTPEVSINNYVDIAINGDELYVYRKFLILKKQIKIVTFKAQDLTWEESWEKMQHFKYIYKVDNTIYISDDYNLGQKNPGGPMFDGLIFINYKDSCNIYDRYRNGNTTLQKEIIAVKKTD